MVENKITLGYCVGENKSRPHHGFVLWLLCLAMGNNALHLRLICSVLQSNSQTVSVRKVNLIQN